MAPTLVWVEVSNPPVAGFVVSDAGEEGGESVFVYFFLARCVCQG